VRLGVPTSTAEDVGHFSLNSREVVRINFKLILQLKLPIIKGRVSSVYKQQGSTTFANRDNTNTIH
jgi:hypothetical protein